MISFSCHSEAMRFFENALLTIGEEERNLLAGILSEAKQAFLPPFDNPYLTRMERATPASFGSEQLIKNYLEQLLIGLLRKQLKPEAVRQLTRPTSFAATWKPITVFWNIWKRICGRRLPLNRSARTI